MDLELLTSEPLSSGGAARVAALLDTSHPEQPARSCMAAALREARALTGRDVVTGELKDEDHQMTWAGALVHFVVIEQMGSCFHPLSAWPTPAPREAGLKEGLIWFGNVTEHDAGKLYQLRNRFSHDYSLEPPRRRERYVLHDEPSPLFERRGGQPRVSLVALADVAETVVKCVNTLASKGELGVHHVGGMERVEKRFMMRFLQANDVGGNR